jgi:hypothetical protein
MYRLSERAPSLEILNVTLYVAIVKTLRLLFGTCFENMIDGMPTEPVSGCAI